MYKKKALVISKMRWNVFCGTVYKKGIFGKIVLDSQNNQKYSKYKNWENNHFLRRLLITRTTSYLYSSQFVINFYFPNEKQLNKLGIFPMHFFCLVSISVAKTCLSNYQVHVLSCLWIVWTFRNNSRFKNKVPYISRTNKIPVQFPLFQHARHPV